MPVSLLDGAWVVVFTLPILEELLGQNIKYLFGRMLYAAIKKAEISMSTLH